jgi:(S)-mandelate dehydrogenase
VNSGFTLLVDSGFRRGADIVQALALGADAVLLGRAMLYGLAAGGEAGVKRALDILASEISRTLALLGLSSVDELSPEVFA